MDMSIGAICRQGNVITSAVVIIDCRSAFRQHGVIPLVAKKKLNCMQAYENKNLLLTGFITSVNSFLISVCAKVLAEVFFNIG